MYFGYLYLIMKLDHLTHLSKNSRKLKKLINRFSQHCIQLLQPVLALSSQSELPRKPPTRRIHLKTLSDGKPPQLAPFDVEQRLCSNLPPDIIMVCKVFRISFGFQSGWNLRLTCNSVICVIFLFIFTSLVCLKSQQPFGFFDI